MKKLHFIAIGGAAMHNLAISLHKNGYKVTGSDDIIFDPALSNLEKYNLLPKQIGWFPENITAEIDAIILGMHAKIDNPELLKAEQLGIKIFSFPEFIYEHSKSKLRIVVAGSHGKTTITSMIMHVMHKSGYDFDYLSGASIKGVEGNVKLSESSKYIVIEGDEYLTSPIDLRPKFHLYKPHIAIISGIAWDHINVFKTEEEYIKQFQIFSNLIEENGKLIYFKDDINVEEIASKVRKDIALFEYKEPSFYLSENMSFLRTETGEIKLNVFGTHNMQNIEAARIACNQVGIKNQDFYHHIATYEGAYNRLTKIVENENIIVFRDFAHAPSKVLATVNAIKNQYPNKKVIACLELHTYSSLNYEFIPHYKNTLNLADNAILYYNPQNIAIKKLKSLDTYYIKNSFNNEKLEVYSDSFQLHKRLFQFAKNKETVIVLMSSGNFDNLNFKEFDN